MYSVNTGAIPMVVSISIAVTFIKLKKSVTFAALDILVGRTYANSFLGTLNARRILNSSLRRNTNTEVQEFDLTTRPHAPFKLGDTKSGKRESLKREQNLKERAENLHENNASNVTSAQDLRQSHEEISRSTHCTR
ncbi:hypothetical protein K474DRAFT_1670259 [Panus rudis PR-1116 ss-1]|nr:hypothetical protein K474DRAFT_1670259 [Panus rudis PR-1116 ss-1]